METEPMKDFWDFIKFLSAPLLGLAALFAILAWCTHESPEERKTLFNAWQKVSGNTNLTVEEWSSLRRKKLLPGQGQDETTVVPVPIIMPTGR
jgi:hypothetical protein